MSSIILIVYTRVPPYIFTYGRFLSADLAVLFNFPPLSLKVPVLEYYWYKLILCYHNGLWAYNCVIDDVTAALDLVIWLVGNVWCSPSSTIITAGSCIRSGVGHKIKHILCYKKFKFKSSKVLWAFICSAAVFLPQHHLHHGETTVSKCSRYSSDLVSESLQLLSVCISRSLLFHIHYNNTTTSESSWSSTQNNNWVTMGQAENVYTHPPW
jgi:hypothetical protein